MTVPVIYRRIDGKLARFVKTISKVYVNVAFIYCLSVSYSKRRGWQVKAWCDTEHDDHFILAEFTTEADAEDFLQWFIAEFNLEKEADGDDANTIFQNWRREKWEEKHGSTRGKVSLMKPLF